MKVIPKKRLGQHFLRDRRTLERILHALEPGREEVVVEVGAGDGSLTRLLAPAVGRLIVVEIDPECSEPLRAVLEPFPAARLVPGDVLELDPVHLLALEAGARAAAVGNLPYNVATAIVQRFLTAGSLFSRMVFMVQLEVAQRIVARPGTRSYGYLSVFCQYHASARVCFSVRPECFVPRPGVMSAVVELEPTPGLAVTGASAPPLVAARAAFAHRRKTLANSLKQSPGFGELTPELLGAAGIDGRRRAEALEPAEYAKLGAVWARHADAARKD